MTILALLVDRDGTLTQDRGYTHKVSDLAWFAESLATLVWAARSGIKVAVVTNQGGVGLGKFDEDDVASFHQEMSRQADRAGATIDLFLYCPHHPRAVRSEYREDCPNRKPRPGLLLEAATALGVRTSECLMIGDSSADRVAATRAAIPFLHVQDGGLRLQSVRDAVCSLNRVTSTFQSAEQ
jgi:D-glycero-D-manno-heptose 1,7-bisphosphate phosphatase